MKKKLFFIPLLLLSLSIGITSVRAENQSNVFTATNFYDNYQYLPDIFSNYSSQINILISYFNSNYSQYSNYVIDYLRDIDISLNDYIILRPVVNSNFDITGSGTFSFHYVDAGGGVQLSFVYNIDTSTYIYNTNSSGRNYAFSKWLPISTKTDFYFVDTVYDKLILPSYTNNQLDVSYSSYELYEGDILPTYQTLTSGNYDTYEEIDLSDYAYVVLSLTDYEQDAFWTNIYTQGRLCLTPVYNYGMTQRNEIMQGTQVQSCTTSYETMTPVNVSVLQSDIDNHAVYYVADYDNEGTVIKVDTDVFDITYVTQENADSPQVTIAGRSYPVIPYSSLTDSATISTDNNYVSGQVCSLGDVNCASEVTGINISDLWTSPLQLFKTVGNSITSVLGVITAFITLLPPTLQAFLYTAFFLVIILGIIKVLL